MDIYDLISSLQEISISIHGLKIITFYSDAQIIASDLTPLLNQIQRNLDSEIASLIDAMEVTK